MRVKNLITFCFANFLIAYIAMGQDLAEQSVGEDKLKGISLAVINNYRIADIQYAGVKSAHSQDKIDENTAFSAASISKPITALICAILEEQGAIVLEEPINNYLVRWQLPELNLLKDIDVTWIHLLSHTAGTTQVGFEDYYEGDEIPTIKESLEGKIPGYDKPISFLFKPGTDYSYSGGGYTIIQMALEDTMKKSLAELAQELLFEPLKMSRTTMYQLNSNNFLGNVASAHDDSGEVIRSGIPITPQIAASGMWTTPTDLAKLVIEIQKALDGQKTEIISKNVANRVTNTHTLKGAGGWSLGFEKKFGFGNTEWFSHGGANTGTGGYLYATMTDGRGFIAFGNGPNSVRMPIINHLRDKIINDYQWRKDLPFEEQHLPKNLVSEIVGTYSNDQGMQLTIKDSIKSIWAKPAPLAPWLPFKYTGDNTFYFELLYPNFILFEKQGSVWTMTLIREGVSDSLKSFLVKKPLQKVKVIFVVSVPNKEDKVFISGNQQALGNWDPGAIQLEDLGDLKRTITLDLIMPAEFKFTQGSWKKEAEVKNNLTGENLKINTSTDTEVRYIIQKWIHN